MAERVMCQCCGRGLVPLADGTSRRHGREGGCKGSGYRLARWEIGRRLEHYTGQIWEVEAIEDLRWPGYRMRCLVQTMPRDRPVGTVEHFNAEYLHRHGWRPLPLDLMAALARSLAAPRAPVPSSREDDGNGRV